MFTKMIRVTGGNTCLTHVSINNEKWVCLSVCDLFVTTMH